MHESSLTDGPQRPRVRRGLGVLVGMTLLASPLALAPAASAQTASGDALGGVGQTLTQTVTSLPNTLGKPLGGADFAGNTSCDNPELLVPFVSCLIDIIDRALGGPAAQATTKAKAKAKVKASLKGGKAKRAVKR